MVSDSLARLSRWNHLLIALALMSFVLSYSHSGDARQAAAKARQGMMWVRFKKCHKAIPFLEEAELLRHQAHIALALADCYASSGKLMDAIDIYRALSKETITQRHAIQDRTAIKNASQRLTEAETRLPTLAFEVQDTYEDLLIFVDGKLIEEPFIAWKVAPDVELKVEVKAKGHETFHDAFSLSEGEHFIRTIKLVALPEPPEPPLEVESPVQPGDWYGVRARSYIIPTFAWRMLGDGGRTVVVPGAALTWTTDVDWSDLMLSIGYASYGVGPTPFKGKGRPDTDWEIIESDMHALYFTAELSWRTALSQDRTWEFYWGGGVGLGWTFIGNLKRTQAYPPDFQPGNPYTYEKCNGPNDPPGSYLYCNELDYDANHYDFNEPDWFSGGKRPLVYPWLAFPQVGLSYQPSQSFALDLELGLTTTGMLLGLGGRVR